VGLTLAANNASADVSNGLAQGIGNALGQAIGGTQLAGAIGGGALSGILGLDSPNNMLSVQNIPTLASLAFAIEMYYNGWVYRGYFDSMDVTERADNFLIDYSMVFTVTQRRGYRTNYFPWSESPVSGPSTYNTPYSFNGNTIVNTNLGVQTVDTSGNIVQTLASLL
jgi:hypothetical protein